MIYKYFFFVKLKKWFLFLKKIKYLINFVSICSKSRKKSKKKFDKIESNWYNPWKGEPQKKKIKYKKIVYAISPTTRKEINKQLFFCKNHRYNALFYTYHQCKIQRAYYDMRSKDYKNLAFFEN